MQRSHPLRAARGFTLIELLTVIAIIAILAAILIPTVGAVRAKAQSAKTASNLRELQKANSSFAADNKGYLFGNSLERGPWGGGWFLSRAFGSYLGMNAQWNPGVRDDFNANGWGDGYPEVGKTGRAIDGPWGANRNMTIAKNATQGTHYWDGAKWVKTGGWQAGFWMDTKIQTDLIERPSNYLTFYEAADFWGVEWDRLKWVDDGEGQFSTGMAFRNGGYCNVVFADGHVGRFNRAEMEPDTPEVRAYFNWAP